MPCRDYEYENSILYLIVRTDMDSMTPGRVAAQTAHGHGAMEEMINDAEYDDLLLTTWLNWKSYRGFGTTIVLRDTDIDSNKFSLEEINLEIINDEEYLKPIISTYVVDETYPVQDGSVVHLISVKTVLAVFVVDKNDKPDILSRLKLY